LAAASLTPASCIAIFAEKGGKKKKAADDNSDGSLIVNDFTGRNGQIVPNQRRWKPFPLPKDSEKVDWIQVRCASLCALSRYLLVAWALSGHGGSCEPPLRCVSLVSSHSVLNSAGGSRVGAAHGRRQRQRRSEDVSSACCVERSCGGERALFHFEPAFDSCVRMTVRSGFAIHVYACNTSMGDKGMCNSDGDFLIGEPFVIILR
jgi:hypothetical protein